MSFRQGFVEKEHVKLYYRVYGESGVPVVLVMGTGGSHRGWIPQVRALTDLGYRAVLMDNRGTGQTQIDLVKHPLTITDMAEDVEAIRCRLGLDKFHLVGMSLGSVISQYYAAKYGSHLLSLQLHVPIALAEPDSSITALCQYFLNEVIPNYDHSSRSLADSWAAYNRAMAPLVAPPWVYDSTSALDEWCEKARLDPHPTTEQGLRAQWILNQGLTSQAQLARIASLFPSLAILVNVAEKDKMLPAEYGMSVYDELVKNGSQAVEMNLMQDGCHLANIFEFKPFNQIMIKFLQLKSRRN